MIMVKVTIITIIIILIITTRWWWCCCCCWWLAAHQVGWLAGCYVCESVCALMSYIIAVKLGLVILAAAAHVCWLDERRGPSGGGGGGKCRPASERTNARRSDSLNSWQRSVAVGKLASLSLPLPTLLQLAHSSSSSPSDKLGNVAHTCSILHHHMHLRDDLSGSHSKQILAASQPATVKVISPHLD